MDRPTTRGRSNRKTSLLSLQQRRAALMSRWSKEDERLLFGDQRGHRHAPMNYDYDFPIEKWSERRIAAEKREIEKSSSSNTKPSSRWKQRIKSSKDPDMPVNGHSDISHRLTICSLLHHCESIPDFEKFKGQSLIVALRMSHRNGAGPTQQSVIEEAKVGKAAHHVGGASTVRDAENNGSTDDKASSPLTMMRIKKMTSADPEQMDSNHPEQSIGRNHSSDENENYSVSVDRLNSDSILRLSTSDSTTTTTLKDESGSSTFKSKKLELPVRFYYTRLNAAVQARLNQLNHHGALASIVWKSPAHPPLPFLTPPTNPDQYPHSTGLVPSSPRYLHLSSAEGVTSSTQPCLTSMAKILNGYLTSDASYSASGVLSKPMTKQSVLAALARVRFQTECPNASAVLLPPALPPNRQTTRKLCGEEPPQQQQQQQQQWEASAELEARGQTCVIHDSSSINVDAVSKVQLFHIGDLLQAMDRNRRRETPLPSYLGSAADISL